MRPETLQFVGELGQYSQGALHYKEEVALLLDLAREGNKVQVFEDAVFQAKFLSRSFEIMRRIGPDGDGYDKVATEFRSAMEKASALVKTLVKESPDEVKQRFMNRFFQLNQESMSAFMELLKDLAWVKNWMVDGKPLP